MKNAFILGFSAILILTGAYFLRQNTFWLPHWKGDQNQYIALAMKLERQGLDGYNLRHVDFGFRIVTGEPLITLAHPVFNPNKEAGDLLQVMEKVGFGYYNEPLHMRAPLYPFLLGVAHRILAPQQPFFACSTSFLKEVVNLKPTVVRDSQFWICALQLALNLGVIFLTLLLAYRLFGNVTTSVLAGLLMALNPLSLWLAHKVLNEDCAVFMALLSFVLLFYSFPKISWKNALAGGVFAGLAILTNQRMLLIGGILGLYAVFQWLLEPRKSFGLTVKQLTPFFIYGCAAFAVSAFWFWEVYQQYGHPLHLPQEGMTQAKDITGWDAAVSRLDHGSVLFLLRTVYLAPILALAFWSFVYLDRNLAHKNYGKHFFGVFFCFLWVAVIYFFFAEPSRFLFGGTLKELRYYYVAYPAVIILGAFFLERAGEVLGAKSGFRFLKWIFIAGFVSANAAWSLPLAYEAIFNTSLLF